ncbi:MAG TPA: Mov34/MPN/PAD-1 family protein [Thermoplasmata archaeon]|nr:Mov34/MPN/PAD-1 family protein [Thermoplasmata archaeon]
MPIFRPHRRRPEGGPRLGDTPSAITRRALESALASAHSAYPNEFGGVLRAEPPGVISELLLLPGTTAGRRHANFQLWMLHADLSVAGTVHSHPSGALHPSDADLRLFRSWGRRHLILGAPFGPGAWRAYDGNGRETHLDVIENAGAARVGAPGRYHRPAPLPSESTPPAPDEFPEDEA